MRKEPKTQEEIAQANYEWFKEEVEKAWEKKEKAVSDFEDLPLAEIVKQAKHIGHCMNCCDLDIYDRIAQESLHFQTQFHYYLGVLDGLTGANLKENK